MPLPPHIEKMITDAEQIVASDIERMQLSIESIDADAIPEETFDDPSFVKHVEDVRSNARRTARVAERALRASQPPPLRAKGA